MDLDALLNKPVFRQIRDAAATIRAISFFIGIVIGAVAAFYFTLGRRLVSVDLAIVIAAALLVISATIIAATYYNKNVSNPVFYEIVELQGSLVVAPVSDHYHYTYIRWQRIRALRDEVRLIELRGHWTGVGKRGSTTVAPLRQGHILLDGAKPEEDGRIHRWIYPRRSLRKGEVIEVGIRQSHEDEVQTQLPYFREGGGRYPTGKITVSVKFPYGADPQNAGEVSGAVWKSNRSIGNNRIVGSLPIARTVDAQRNFIEYCVTVDRPVRHHSYGLTWSWPD